MKSIFLPKIRLLVWVSFCVFAISPVKGDEPPEPAFAGGTGSPDDPWLIETAVQLDAVRDHAYGHFRLANDIELDSSPYNEGEGWVPIDWMGGSLDGSGFEIQNLMINRPVEEQHGMGLIRHIGEGAVVKNLTLRDANVTGAHTVGALAGFNIGLVKNVTVTGGSVVGEVLEGDEDADDSGLDIGALVGKNYNGAFIEDCVAENVEVTGARLVGGLVGWNKKSTIRRSQVIGGTVNAWEDVGGLVGSNEQGLVEFSSSSANVVGGAFVGGLVGINSRYGKGEDLPISIVRYSHATGDVAGELLTGGLVGINEDSALIERSFATGSVTGVYLTGGLVGGNIWDAQIDNTYATGDVSGHIATGGLVGANGLLLQIHEEPSGDDEELPGYIYRSYAVGSVTALPDPEDETVAGMYLGNLIGTMGIIGREEEEEDHGEPEPLGEEDDDFLLGFDADVGAVFYSFWLEGEADGIGMETGKVTESYGVTEAEMQTLNTFSGEGWAWDFSGVWAFQEGVNEDFPVLLEAKPSFVLWVNFEKHLLQTAATTENDGYVEDPFDDDYWMAGVIYAREGVSLHDWNVFFGNQFNEVPLGSFDQEGGIGWGELNSERFLELNNDFDGFIPGFFTVKDGETLLGSAWWAEGLMDYPATPSVAPLFILPTGASWVGENGQHVHLSAEAELQLSWNADRFENFEHDGESSFDSILFILLDVSGEEAEEVFRHEATTRDFDSVDLTNLDGEGLGVEPGQQYVAIVDYGVARVVGPTTAAAGLFDGSTLEGFGLGYNTLLSFSIAAPVEVGEGEIGIAILRNAEEYIFEMIIESEEISQVRLKKGESGDWEDFEKFDDEFEFIRSFESLELLNASLPGEYTLEITLLEDQSTATYTFTLQTVEDGWFPNIPAIYPLESAILDPGETNLFSWTWDGNAETTNVLFWEYYLDEAGFAREGVYEEGFESVSTIVPDFEDARGAGVFAIVYANAAEGFLSDWELSDGIEVFAEAPIVYSASFDSLEFYVASTLEEYLAVTIPDESLRGPYDSPAGDGIPNLLKYATGLAPMERVNPSDFKMVQGIESGEEEGRHLKAYFYYNPALLGYDYLIEHSSDLTVWDEVDPEWMGLEEHEGRMRWVVEMPLEGNLRGFLRLRVQEPESP